MFKPFYCCFGLFLFWIFSFKDVQPGLFFIRIFRVLHTVQSLIFKVRTLFRANAEGGIWTLAPLLTTYSLSRGAPSTTWVLLHWLTHILLFCKIVIQFCTRNSSLWLRSTVSGESGIRTHAPLRTNGFQDRLVMTTSISLHMLLTAFVVFSPPTQVIF